MGLQEHHSVMPAQDRSHLSLSTLRFGSREACRTSSGSATPLLSSRVCKLHKYTVAQGVNEAFVPVILSPGSYLVGRDAAISRIAFCSASPHIS